MDKITLKQVGFWVEGSAILNLWGGGQGKIEMTLYMIKENTLNNIIAGINDGGFGCESIESVEVEISKYYQRGITDFLEKYTIPKEKLLKAKRGIQ